MELTFWGAARTVTGSLHELTLNGRRIFLDCGLFQGRRAEAEARNRQLPVPPTSVDAVVLSHAHIDHSGNLPSLTRGGFHGPIFATPATIDLCRSMLQDSAEIQEKDAAFFNKRSSRRRTLDPRAEHGSVTPLYTVEDAGKAIGLFRPVSYHARTQVTDGVAIEFVDAGHMLGSASVALTLEENGAAVRLGFSGDVGRPNLPIIRDPETLPPVDYLIMESTYGDRLHEDIGPVADKLADVINRTAARGGKIVMPAFAVGRTQQIVLLLHQLTNEKRIPSIPIFVDSPLAVDVTGAFRRHPECYDAETGVFLEQGEDPFGFSRLRYVRDAGISKGLNELRGPFVVISASGMCEVGRILHHLRHSVEEARNTILITGFQAESTLGRRIVERQPEIPIFGEPFRLRAEVVKLNELSGHADQAELIEWFRPLADKVKRVFLVHGEPRQSEALAEKLEADFGVAVTVPERGQRFRLPE